MRWSLDQITIRACILHPAHFTVPIFIEYIDGVRGFLETETDKDQQLSIPIVKEIRIHFLGFIRHLIASFQLDKRRTLIRKELRRNLFNLFASWSGTFGQLFGLNTRPTNSDNTCTEFEFMAIQSMLAVLCSGPYFDREMFAEEGEVLSYSIEFIGVFKAP